MRLERTFHPVGHGAFYTERFYNDNGNNVANIVFDCGCYEGPGSGKSKPYFDKQINDIVDTIFPLCEDKTKIAALFISHFHTDHINGIPRLLNNCKVERIIMPKLTDDLLLELFLYEIIYHQFSAAEAQNSLDSFLNTVKHIKIEVEIDCSDNDEAVDFEEIEIDKIGVGYLISKPIIINVQSLWKYIPFSTKEKKSQLKQALITGVPELKSALSGTSINIRQIAEEFTNKPALIDKCRKVYDSCFGNNQQHNRYSMTLFSGTCDVDTTCIQQCHQHVKDLSRYCTKNCLYMGDFEANPKHSIKNTNCDQLLKFYGKYWKKIGIFQVPHHGSHDNINTDLYAPPKLAIVSAGKQDVNGHPHIDVINLLQKHNCIPMIVTEDIRSIKTFSYRIK